MKLLVINPNISESVSALIAAEARRVASAETQITMQTASFGVAYIETRFEAMIGAMAVAELAGAHADGHDALVICLLYTSPSPRDRTRSRMPSSA